QKAGDSVLNRFGDARMTGRHHRDAAGRALDHDIGKALSVAVARGAAWRGEQGRAAKPGRDIAGRLSPEELRLHAQLTRLALKPLAQRPLADHDQPYVLHPGERGNQVGRPLFLHQPADTKDRPRLARPLSRLEAVEIDAVTMGPGRRRREA